jgi:hypothetical protein
LCAPVLDIAVRYVAKPNGLLLYQALRDKRTTPNDSAQIILVSNMIDWC